MSAVHALEQFEFHQTVENTAGTAIVFFSSGECLSCRYWQQLLEHYSKLRPEIHIFKIDAGRDQALTEEFQVFDLPSLFLYHDGAFHSALQCEANIGALDRNITEALAAPAEEMP